MVKGQIIFSLVELSSLLDISLINWLYSIFFSIDLLYITFADGD